VNKIKHVNQRKKVIIGDRIARNSVAELQHTSGWTFAVSSFVKSGAGMRVIVDTVKEEIMELKSDDVIVILGGSNDIGKNNSKEALKHLLNFVKNNHMVAIVVMTATPRNDLPYPV
jgi:hypothetical protein